MTNYFWNWQKRFERFVRGTPIEELAAECVSFALANSQGSIDWTQTRKDYQEALNILIKNKLARKSTPQIAT